MKKNNNKGNWNTGDLNTGNLNTGNRNTGDLNTGNWNTGDLNTGNRNTGDLNTGNWNTGDLNTGDLNTGNRNTGDLNTGNLNTGDYNKGNRNTGYFNTITPKNFIFNKETDLVNLYFPNFCYFRLTEWIMSEYMTDKEKKDYPSYSTTGGYLKKHPYKEAFRKSWDKAPHNDRVKIIELPNWNNDVFFEISGINVEKELLIGKYKNIEFDINKDKINKLQCEICKIQKQIDEIKNQGDE